jgi:hypothetical protein
MELNITPEDIERIVKDTILKSGFGKVVEDSVKKALGGYNSPVEEAIKAHVRVVAQELIKEKFDIHIREAVAISMEKMVTIALVEKLSDYSVQKMVTALERY